VTTGKKSTEKLVHFQCGECKKWWSIGDAPKKIQWFCPWCGKEQKFR
jgi:ribosomal protein L44E